MKGEMAQKDSRLGMAATVVATALLGVLMCWQGGYYPVSVGALGLAFVVAAGIVLAMSRKANIGWASACFLAIGALYLASALAHGASVSNLQEPCVWLLAACVCASIPGEGSTFDAMCELPKWLAWMGVVSAGLGVLMFLGMLPIDGTVHAERLQFLFQYANTAGLWFAVAALLCMFSGDTRLEVLSVLPIVAMVMTKSGGAMVVFALIAVTFALVRMFVLRKAGGESAGGNVGSTGGTSVASSFASRHRSSLVIWGIIALVVVGAIIMLAASPTRASQAAGTLAERFLQMQDASSLIAQNPWLGIGPDQWRWEYRYIQSDFYVAAVVHSSYVQMSLDAGILAPALLVAVFVIGAVGLVRRNARSDDGGSKKAKDDTSANASLNARIAIGAALSAMAVHSLIDFDMQFGFMVVLLAALVGAVKGNAAKGAESNRHDTLSLAVECAMLAICLASCVLCLAMSAQSSRMSELAESGDPSEAIQMAQNDPLLESDRQAQIDLCTAAVRANDTALIDEFASKERLSGNEALTLAQYFYDRGEPEKAEEILDEQLELQLNNGVFIEAARKMRPVEFHDATLSH